MEAARDRRASSQTPQLGQDDTTTPAAEHETSLGVSMGGTSRLPFRAPTGGTMPGDKIPPGSFLTRRRLLARTADGLPPRRRVHSTSRLTTSVAAQAIRASAPM
jgi:hypothetical protein